jgi:hypothetical protein
MKARDFTLWRNRLGLNRPAAAQLLRISVFRIELIEDWRLPIARNLAIHCFALEQAFILTYRYVFSNKFSDVPHKVLGHRRARALRYTREMLLNASYADINQSSISEISSNVLFNSKDWPGLGVRYVSLL